MSPVVLLVPVTLLSPAALDPLVSVFFFGRSAFSLCTRTLVRVICRTSPSPPGGPLRGPLWPGPRGGPCSLLCSGPQLPTSSPLLLPPPQTLTLGVRLPGFPGLSPWVPLTPCPRVGWGFSTPRARKARERRATRSPTGRWVSLPFLFPLPFPLSFQSWEDTTPISMATNSPRHLPPRNPLGGPLWPGLRGGP